MSTAAESLRTLSQRLRVLAEQGGTGRLCLDPQTITALLDRLEALEAVAEAAKALRSVCDACYEDHGYADTCTCRCHRIQSETEAALRDALSRLDGAR